MVGIELPSSGAQGSNPFVAGNVEFRPREFTTAINTWAEVPLCTTDFAPYGDKSVDHLAAVHTAANFAKGIGDVCRYMGVVDGANWRMPTATEWAELYGSDQDKGQSVKLGNGWVNGSYYPLSGYAMGAGRSDVSISGNGADARVTSADPYDDGAVFFPASGYRNLDNGEIYGIGSDGLYWSATAADSGNGYYMWFNSSGVRPQGSSGRTYAFSVRCIRE